MLHDCVPNSRNTICIVIVGPKTIVNRLYVSLRFSTSDRRARRSFTPSSSLFFPRRIDRCDPFHRTGQMSTVDSVRLNVFLIPCTCVSRRSPESRRIADAGPERVPVRDGRRAAQGGRTSAAATAPVGPDRVRQDYGGRRAGHVDRLRTAPGAAPDAAAERGLRERGRGGRVPATAPGVPARVRTALVPRPSGQPAGRRRLAADASRPFSRSRGLPGAADVHQDLRVRRLMTRRTPVHVVVGHRSAWPRCTHVPRVRVITGRRSS